MKKTICLLIVFIFLLCGCSQTKQPDQSNQLNIGSFSYEDDFASYKDDSGVIQSGFVNQEKAEVSNASQAIELAKKECTVDYDTIHVDFDASTMIYRVSFSKTNSLGGNEDVYINQEGITQLIVYGE